MDTLSSTQSLSESDINRIEVFYPISELLHHLSSLLSTLLVRILILARKA